MISSDHELLVGVVDLLKDHVNQAQQFQDYVIRRFDAIDKRFDVIEQEQKEMRTEIRQLQEDVHVINKRFDDLHIYGGWLLAGITLIATIMTVVIPFLTSLFTRNNQPQPQQPVQPQPQTQQPLYIVLPSEIRTIQSESKTQPQ